MLGAVLGGTNRGDAPQGKKLPLDRVDMVTAVAATGPGLRAVAARRPIWKQAAVARDVRAIGTLQLEICIVNGKWHLT